MKFICRVLGHRWFAYLAKAPVTGRNPSSWLLSARQCRVCAKTEWWDFQ